MINFIQRNINGFYSKLEELQLLTKEHTPTMISLQETNFTDRDKPSLSFYNIFKNNRNLCDRASGGVAILVSQEYPSEEKNISSDLEVVAVSIILPHNKITICNLYLPNQKNFSLTDIVNIIHQLHQPFILVGDFNSHSQNWGSYKTDTKGKIIEELLTDDNLVLLNTGQPTRINPSNGQFSAIDLSISNTSLAHKLDWTFLPDLYSSDHIPILISLTSPLIKNDLYYPPRWKIKEANWNLFNTLLESISSTLEPPSKEKIDDNVKLFSKPITNTANISIGMASNKTSRARVPWWNEEIKISIINKNKSLKKYIHTHDPNDFIQLKRHRALTRYLVKHSKAAAWKAYTSSLNNQTDPSEIWCKIKPPQRNVPSKQYTTSQ